MCALVLLMGCARDGAQMREQLSALEQRNSSGEPMENDTLAEALVDYFDRHGSANERMRAKYILGRTYYCLGELPRALETYMEAADCADTTAADCDFAKLSRIHAQSAVIFNQQVQPRSQLRELRLAEHYAWKGLDTLQAIECYAQEADAYDFLHQHDSIIYILERAARMFSDIGRLDRASQTISTAILSLIARDDLLKARTYCNIYEERSGFFDKDGNIEEGREVYYYIKGKYYLAVNRLDSAEFLFRKELRDGKDLNNQIAGCKGLQEVFVEKKNPDSIAKYATLSYELNDSAYSLAEMQSIQKMQASYNFSHHKLLAEQSIRLAERIQSMSFLIIIGMIAICATFFMRYKNRKAQELSEYRNNLLALEKVQSELLELCGEDADVPSLIARKNAEIKELQRKVSDYQKRSSGIMDPALEDKLSAAKVMLRFRDYLEKEPVQVVSTEDMRELKNLINELIPGFYGSLNSTAALRPIEYEVCLLIRCHFKPSSISKLLGRDDAYISNIRKRILKKVFMVEGNPKELDDRILRIV